MWKGEDYISSNPKIVQDALDNYCAKLEFLKKENPSEPEFIPKSLIDGVDAIVQRVKDTQETIKSEDANKIHNLQDKMDFIRSALKKYKEDTKQSLDKIKAQFGDDIKEPNDFTRLIRDIDEAVDRTNRP